MNLKGGIMIETMKSEVTKDVKIILIIEYF